MLKYLFLIVLLAACTATPDDDAPLVYWVADGQLWENSRPIVIGNVVQAYVSESGRVAFTRGANGLPETLWLYDGEAQQISAAPSLIHQVLWAGDTLYFNTMAAGDLAPMPREDLYRVNADATLTAIEPGGQVSVHDGSVIVTKAGIYGETPGEIWLVDPLTKLLEFPAVATGSHFVFYPEIQWLDDQTAWVALPDADAVYNELAVDAPPVALWRMTLNSQAEQVSTVQASFFGLPVWNAEGRMAYLQRSGAVFTLVVDDAVYATDVLTRPFWFHDHLIYGKADGYYWDDEKWLEGQVLQFEVTPFEILYLILKEENYEISYADVQGNRETITTIEGEAPVLATGN